MLTLSTGQKLELLEAVDELEESLDFLSVDTGAGIHDNVVYFNLAAQERIVVLTPEPTSLTDAYALIKVLKLRHGVERFRVLINMSPDEKNAKSIFARLHAACDQMCIRDSRLVLPTPPLPEVTERTRGRLFICFPLEGGRGSSGVSGAGKLTFEQQAPDDAFLRREETGLKFRTEGNRRDGQP